MHDSGGPRSEGGHRVPPQNLEAEQAVLGAALLDREAVGRAMEIIASECFYRDAHRKVFDAMVSLYSKGLPIDLIHVKEELQSRGHLDAVGGTAFLSHLQDQVATAAGVEDHARLVLEKHVMRELIRTGTEIVRRTYDGGGSSGEMIDSAEQMIFAINDPRMKKGFASIRSLLPHVITSLELAYETKRVVTGVPSGFSDLDGRTAGFQPSDLIIVAGRPAMGKTSLCLNVAEHAALEHNVPVGIFSLEMSRDQLVQRLLSSKSKIQSNRFRTGFISENEWKSLIDAAGVLTEAPIYIDDTPAPTIMEIRAKARRLKVEHNLSLLVVDYLQMVRGIGRPESRQQEISEISRSLKALAKELQIPVIALSQLSRAVEGREEKRPVLADLRESGAIEQDADLVLFVYREEEYAKEARKEEVRGQAEVIIGKHRNGPVGTVRLYFEKALTRFQSLDPRTDEYFPGA